MNKTSEITVTHTAYGHTYTATLSSDRRTVEIDRDGIWAGRGRWDGSIEDCAANLVSADDLGDGADEMDAIDASCDVYDALDTALADAIAAEPEYVVAYGDDAEQWGRVVSLEAGKALADEELADEPDVTIWLATVYDDSRAGGLPPEATRRNGTWIA